MTTEEAMKDRYSILAYPTLVVVTKKQGQERSIVKKLLMDWDSA